MAKWSEGVWVVSALCYRLCKLLGLAVSYYPLGEKMTAENDLTLRPEKSA